MVMIGDSNSNTESGEDLDLSEEEERREKDAVYNSRNEEKKTNDLQLTSMNMESVDSND